MTEEEFYFIGGILHEARMKECYGNMQISSRVAWPATMKEFRAARTIGQPHIDVAVAQAKALEPYLVKDVLNAKGRDPS